MLNDRFKVGRILGETIDEDTVPWGQYLPDKSHKYGVRYTSFVHLMAILEFKMYAGKNNTTSEKQH